MTSVALVTVVTAVVIFLLAQDVRRHIVSSRSEFVSPLATAERSLAHRYARGEITARDYERVLHLIRD